jgi:methyl-accepting chemotaxis protein
MQWRNLRIGYRLGIGFCLILALSVGLNLFTVYQMDTLAGLTQKLYHHPFAVETALLRIEGDMVRMHRAMKDIALSTTPAEVPAQVALIDHLEQEVLQDLTLVRERYLGDPREVREVEDRLAQWRPIRAEVIRHIETGERDQALTIVKGRATEHVAALEKVLNGIRNFASDKAKSLAEQAGASRDNALHLAILALAGLLVLCAGLAYTLTRSITRPLAEAVATAQRLSTGDFTTSVAADGRDETGELLTALGQMSGAVSQALREVHGAAATFAEAAGRTSTTMDQTNQNLQRQQSAVEQIATAMNEMSLTVQEVARNANQAREAASTASAEAGKGRQVVQEVTTAIQQLAAAVGQAGQVVQRLAQRSDTIGTVLEVIRSIAEQTNLLALNAAIEAARAGEQGRGFAVVADEVRTLAHRTQQSTQEIRQMIEQLQADSREAVQVMERGRTQTVASVEQSTLAVQSLEAIARAVTVITDMNIHIASASEEQSAVAEDVNRNIQDIAHRAAQTAQGTAQTVQASAQVAARASQLQQVMERFRLG